MAYRTVFLLFCSLSAYAGEILLDESEAKINTVHQDTVIRLDESPSDRLILVENQDLDTYGSITNKDQTMHSASWMGPYGHYLIHIPAKVADFKIQVSPLKSSVNSTKVKLTLLSLEDKSASFLEAVQKYTQANDLRIKHYLGQDNQTQQAIEFFKAAAVGFKQENAEFFLALTYFELGNALTGVGEQIEGLNYLEQSVALWSEKHSKQSIRAKKYSWINLLADRSTQKSLENL
jgi:tetratricopeptide (TPR) repeat protein